MTDVTPPDTALLNAEAARLQRYSLWALLALIAWLMISTVATAPAGLSLLTLLVGWLLQSLPLWLFVPGLRAGRARSGVWLGFVLMFYFVFAVLNAFAPGLHGLLATVEAALISGVFLLVIRFVKAQRATQNGAL